MQIKNLAIKEMIMKQLEISWEENDRVEVNFVYHSFYTTWYSVKIYDDTQERVLLKSYEISVGCKELI